MLMALLERRDPSKVQLLFEEKRLVTEQFQCSSRFIGVIRESHREDTYGVVRY
jgi:hypothetical protein